MNKLARELRHATFTIPDANGKPFTVEATPIQRWMYEQAGINVNTHDPSRDQMSFAEQGWFDGPAGRQAMRFRDMHLFKAGLGYYVGSYRTIYVIGHHSSKSNRLPVVLYARPEIDTYIIVRDNFYDTKISVSSPRLIEDDLLPYLGHVEPELDPEYTGRGLASCYFEGFPEQLVYGFHSQALLAGHGRWSISVGNFPMAAFAIMRGLGLIKPLVHQTPESHRKLLDANGAANKLDREAHERWMEQP